MYPAPAISVDCRRSQTEVDAGSIPELISSPWAYRPGPPNFSHHLLVVLSVDASVLAAKNLHRLPSAKRKVQTAAALCSSAVLGAMVRKGRDFEDQTVVLER